MATRTRTRLTRTEQTERNRARVLAAARDLLLRRGFHAVSVEEIADAAGFSRGVVYSQFGTKADLLLALLEARIEERAEQNRRLVHGLAGDDAVRAIAVAGAADHERNADWTLLLIEFRAHAARDPELSARYAAVHERTVGALADTLADVYDRAGTEPRQPVRVLARAMLAVGTGIALEHHADPEAFRRDDFVVADVFEPIFGAVPRPNGAS
jgi:AcrR family transcriptional regulator